MPPGSVDRSSARVALVGLVLVAACGGGAPPRLEVTPSTIAADQRSTAPAIEARYQLRNGGGRPLLLDGVVPACGCTTASRLPPALKPGATTTLALDCRPPHATGRVVRDVHVRSSDPIRPDVTAPLAFEGVAAAPDPTALYLGYVPVGGSVSRDIVLTSPVSPVALPLPPNGFTIEALPPRADAATGLRVRFTPTVPGVTHAVLDLGTAGTIAATGVGYREILTFPAEIVLPAATGAVGLAGITVMGLGADPLEITRVEYPPGLSGELRTVVPGRQFRVQLRSRGIAASGDAMAVISLHTDSSEEPTVVIPIAGAPSS